MNVFVEFSHWFFGRIGDMINPPKPKPPMPYLPSRLVEIADTQVGITESSRNQGEGIEKYWEATNYPDGYKNREPYCAAFICWLVKQAVGSSISYSFKLPQSATAYGFEDWSLKQDSSTNTKKNPRGEIRRGDLVIFKFSHIGIATGAPDKNGHFRTIEANTGPSGERDGDGVWRKVRHIDLVRSRIRFTV